MAYGFSTKSYSDGSLVISDSTKNAFYAGDGVLYNTDVPNNDPIARKAYYKQFRLPNANNSSIRPVVFHTCAYYCLLYQLEWSSTYNCWICNIECQVNYNMRVLYFLPSTAYQSSSVSGSYGLKVYNSSGTLTFDSRWNKKLLVVDDIALARGTSGYTSSYDSSITVPAVPACIPYHHSKTTGEFYHMWTKLSGGTLYNLEGRYFDTPGTTYELWGSGVYTYIPIIDSTLY